MQVGAWLEGEGVRFRLWSPTSTACWVELGTEKHRLAEESNGYFSGLVFGASAGARYKFCLQSSDSTVSGPFPDPASRWQPDGVHGTSCVVDQEFGWSDASWPGMKIGASIYELHIGTFTEEGTFQAAMGRLSYLKSLGVDAIELMPLADCPGERNWGYDGVCLFAPAHSYGSPNDVKAFVDAAHNHGLAVVIDVVYNHLGPDGNYLGAYSPFYFTEQHKTPWGAGINYDGDHCHAVRNFIVQNAVMWIVDYHFDGLRLDATHAMMDNSDCHILKEITQTVREVAAKKLNKLVCVMAEDDRNDAALITPGKYGLDGLWADDVHHQLRVMANGDNEAYFQDFTGSAADLCSTIQQGWFYCGQQSPFQRKARGTPPPDTEPLTRMIACIQNHDQVGNRALGERIHHTVSLPAYRAMSVLLLCLPETPMLFMGQEFACTSPFCFFTDHNAELGKLVTEGRRKEFAAFKAFEDPATREKIPDPQDETTFQKSKLIWSELNDQPHANIHQLYCALIAMRKELPSLHDGSRGSTGTPL
eukprot:TRINITY_DN1862_c0_g1_i4.p1 TRINITY_DN1862_c0_g1~~TRINITY_DN1862_c0_g1_i4.p1  ORF type:complete len:532 (-),score=46.87 TRINITY_DN1862_c0_g1_i4:1229-2824(-)